MKCQIPLFSPSCVAPLPRFLFVPFFSLSFFFQSPLNCRVPFSFSPRRRSLNRFDYRACRHSFRWMDPRCYCRACVKAGREKKRGKKVTTLDLWSYWNYIYIYTCVCFKHYNCKINFITDTNIYEFRSVISNFWIQRILDSWSL